MLRDAIRQHFQGRSVSRWLHLTHGEGQMRARLHAAGAVRAERFDESGWWLEVEGPAARLASLTRGRVDDPDLVAPAAGHP
jgi:GTP-binding protein HflX